MTKASEIENLVACKRRLADKYSRKSKNVKSKPAAARHHRAAEKYRREAERLETAAKRRG